MRSLLTALLCLAGGSALADGFTVRDLRSVEADARAVLGEGFSARAEPQRLTLACPACAGAPAIDLLLGRQTDGTEARVRSGETSLARLEAICRARSPECRLTGLSVTPAVGWITTYPLGSMTGSTAVILRDGDMPTIRSLAADGQVAARNAAALAGAVAPRIVGR